MDWGRRERRRLGRRGGFVQSLGFRISNFVDHCLAQSSIAWDWVHGRADFGLAHQTPRIANWFAGYNAREPPPPLLPRGYLDGVRAALLDFSPAIRYADQCNPRTMPTGVRVGYGSLE